MEHEATFVVYHTKDWPSGAAWSTKQLDYDLPYYAAAMWRPADSAPSVAVPADKPTGRTATLPAICGEAMQEVALTRIALEALTDSVYTFRPGPDSSAIGAAAAEVVSLVGRIATILERESFDIAAEDSLAIPPNRTALMQQFVHHWNRVLNIITMIDAHALRHQWTLLRHGKAVFTRPRGDVLRRLALSPLVHYRGQLVQSMQWAGLEVRPFYARWELPAVIPPGPEGEPA